MGCGALAGRDLVRAMTSPLFISVIIPTRNRGPLLTDTLTSLRAVDYPADQFEIIVVDDGSSDGTADRVRPFLDDQPPRVRYLRQEPLGLNAARNHGICEARGDIIVFTDDDVELPPGWLRAYAAAVAAHPAAGAYGGPVIPRLEGDGYPRTCGHCGTLEELEAYDRGPTDAEAPWVIGANMAMPRASFTQVGRFNENIPCWSGDETEWLIRLCRAGQKIQYVAAARLWHRRPTAVVRRMIVKRKYLKSKGGVWYMRETNRRLPRPGKALRELLRWGWHVVRCRCFIGSVRVAINCGLLVGWVQWILLQRPNPLADGHERS